jgi:hypothetical protein
MNSELQAQSDAITGALRHMEAAMHQDIIVATAILGILLATLIVVSFFR